MFKIVIPCYGDCSDNFDNLIKSIDSQVVDDDVECYFAEDIIADNFKKLLKSLNENKKFVERAPENVISHERDKMQKYESDLSKLQKNLETLQ